MDPLETFDDFLARYGDDATGLSLDQKEMIWLRERSAAIMAAQQADPDWQEPSQEASEAGTPGETTVKHGVKREVIKVKVAIAGGTTGIMWSPRQEVREDEVVTYTVDGPGHLTGVRVAYGSLPALLQLEVEGVKEINVAFGKSVTPDAAIGIVQQIVETSDRTAGGYFGGSTKEARGGTVDAASLHKAFGEIRRDWDGPWFMVGIKPFPTAERSPTGLYYRIVKLADADADASAEPRSPVEYRQYEDIEHSPSEAEERYAEALVSSVMRGPRQPGTLLYSERDAGQQLRLKGESQIDNPDYKFYVVMVDVPIDNLPIILSGWEYKADAEDSKAELEDGLLKTRKPITSYGASGPTGPTNMVKVMARSTCKSNGFDPRDDWNWAIPANYHIHQTGLEPA